MTRTTPRTAAKVLLALVLSLAVVPAAAADADRYGIERETAIEEYEKESGLSKEEIVKHFTLLINRSKTVLRDNHFLGVKTWQNPFDVWVTQELIWETRPDVIIEAGTHRGGSALLWAMFLEQVSPKGRVITIDIKDKRTAAAKTHRLARKVDFLLGGSTDPKIVADVTRRVKGKRVLVILDSLHTKEHVFAELEAYTPLVQLGGYVVVQDTPVGGVYGIHRFLRGTKAWEIDKSRERLLYTVNLDGFLKRVK
jgi:cephalosporin hydroxylase